jgi:hypothetical protein
VREQIRARKRPNPNTYAEKNESFASSPYLRVSVISPALLQALQATGLLAWSCSWQGELGRSGEGEEEGMEEANKKVAV